MRREEAIFEVFGRKLASTNKFLPYMTWKKVSSAAANTGAFFGF
jgi:hypothetical protein